MWMSPVGWMPDSTRPMSQPPAAIPVDATSFGPCDAASSTRRVAFVIHLPVLLHRLRGDGYMRITSKGQVTIPIEVRERLGLLPDTDVDFVVDGDGARIVRRPGRGESRGTRIVR